MPFILGILGIVFLSLVLACFRLSYGECDGLGSIMAEVQMGITTRGIHDSVNTSSAGKASSCRLRAFKKYSHSISTSLHTIAASKHRNT